MPLRFDTYKTSGKSGGEGGNRTHQTPCEVSTVLKTAASTSHATLSGAEPRVLEAKVNGASEGAGAMERFAFTCLPIACALKIGWKI